METHSAFSALRYRNFRLFWFGQLISLTGTWMHQAAQGWLVFELTNSPFYLGLAGTAFSAPILLFTLAGGVMADRHPKKKIMLIAHTTLMFLSLTLAILVVTDTVKVWHVLILAFMIGTVHSIEIPTRQAFLMDLVEKKVLLNAIALNSSAFHAARMLGPAIAGFIMGPLGMASCFFINTFSFIAIIVALLKMRFPEASKEPMPRKSALKEFKEGISYLLHNSDIKILLISVGIISFFGFPYISFIPVYARDILHTGERGLGMLMGCAGAGAFTGAVGLALRGDNTRKGMLMAAAGVVFSVALLVFSVSETVWISYLSLYFLGFGAINQIATGNTIIQLAVPDELRGRVMSAFATMFLGMAPLGNFTVGTLAHYIGTQHALFISACFCLAGILMMLILKPKIFKM